jgi:UPF0755 protein
MKWIARLGVILALPAVLAIAGCWYAYQQYAHRPIPLSQPELEVVLDKGLGAGGLASALNRQGVQVNPTWLKWAARLRGDSSKLKAGSYELKAPVTLAGLLDLITKGDVSQYVGRFIEGWTFRQMRAEVDNIPELKHQTKGLSDAQLLAAIGAPETRAEGLFFPATYMFTKGSSDIDLYRRAYRRQAQLLNKVWTERAQGLPYKTPYDVLIMASIIEKETGRDSDRDNVASVFVNRLKIGMMLQSDPTTIYGMGESFDGNLRRRDLTTDTPYNTYTRGGLTPTPISLPGLASLRAATQPATSKYLYFVARGDGTSEFSENLGAHNRAVDRYQRKRAAASQ